MKGKSVFVRAAAVLLAAVFCWGGAGPRARAAEDRVVRIPCGINDLLYLDDQGQPAGRYLPYLTKLERINNWQFEYVDTTWTQALEQLENGELDLLFPTTFTQDRTATMDFSTLVAGYSAPGLFARLDSEYDYEDFSAFDGARIAVTQGSTNEQMLEEFARDRGFTYQPVYMESNSQKARALERGNVDMIVLTAYNDLSNTALVSLMDAKPFYFSVKKGTNQDLLDELNRGTQQLLKEDPDLVSSTFRQCLLEGSGGMLAFTKEERDFVESGKEVRVGLYADTRPLSYTKSDGTVGGIYTDLMDYVRENSGINLVLYPLTRDQDWRELLRSGELDFFFGESFALNRESTDLQSTDPFYPYDYVLVTKNDCAFGALEDPVIALTRGRFYLGDYVTQNMHAQARFYDSGKECFLAVLKGEADGAMVNNAEYNYQSKNPRFSAMIQWENYRVTTDGGLISTDDIDPVEFSAVNKAVGLLYDDFISTTINDNLNLPYNTTLSDDLYMMRGVLLVAAIVLVVIIAAFLVIRRIRERQRAVLAQHKEYERNQLQVLAALSRDYDAVYYTDLGTDTCKELWVNEDAARAKGAGRVLAPGSNVYSEALRQYVDNFVQPEDRDKVLALSDPAAMLQRLRTTGDFSLRYRVKENQWGQGNFEIHVVELSQVGDGRGMVFGTRCIDEAVRAESDQRQLLETALEAANKASATKSDFLSKMSHDIRTPMNAIIGMTAIAAAHLDDQERVRDALGKISSSSRYLLGLINEVLDMSKIEAGAITLTEEPFNLSEFLNDLLVMVQPQVKQHNHKLEVRIQDIQHEDVLGDSLRIQQAFVNILDNAVKYTPDGGTISLNVRELPIRTPKAARYEFVFRDTGLGMSKEYVAKIFEPFSRAEDLRVSKIQGTGLGMPITQNIVQQMDGTIQVESEEGKGTTFTVTIFLKLQDSQELDVSGLADLSVLVVDDDDAACESVCELLEQIGMKSTGCSSGMDAVAAMKQTVGTPQEFYAAILDWRMPEMDGIETARAIREVAGDELPVIILSAYDWSDIEAEARAAGVNAFLSKPVFKSGLIRQFKTLKSAEEQQTVEKAPHEPLKAIQESDYSDVRVLLVEDNDLNREIAREIMEMAGLQVEEAEDGKEAVEKVTASPEGYYDIIFMDIQMPVMSGYEATRAIRALDRADTAAVPIIAMTANAFLEDIQASKDAGMNEHLSKPIDFDRFSEILKKYLKK